MRKGLEKNRYVTFVLPDLGGGGAEVVVLSLIKELKALGYSCELYLFGNKMDYEFQDNLDLKLRGLHRSNRHLSLMFYLGFLLLSKKRTIWSHVAPLGMLTSFLAVLAGHTALYTEHTKISYSSKDFRFWKIYRWCFTKVINRIKIFTVSPGNALDMEDFYSLPTSSIEVIPNPIRMFSGCHKEFCKSDCLAIGVVGSNKSVKRLDRVASIIEQLAARKLDKKITFLFYGSDETIYNYLSEEIDVNYVEIVCSKFTIDINDVYRDMDILLNTSESETFGNVFVEALSAGCYVIATKTYGSEFILATEVMGICANTTQTSELVRLILDLNLEYVFSPKMIEERRQYALNFASKEIVKRYV